MKTSSIFQFVCEWVSEAPGEFSYVDVRRAVAVALEVEALGPQQRKAVSSALALLVAEGELVRGREDTPSGQRSQQYRRVRRPVPAESEPTVSAVRGRGPRNVLVTAERYERTVLTARARGMSPWDYVTSAWEDAVHVPGILTAPSPDEAVGTYADGVNVKVNRRIHEAQEQVFDERGKLVSYSDQVRRALAWALARDYTLMVAEYQRDRGGMLKLVSA